MLEKPDKEYYIELLQKTAKKEDRLPKKSDFEQEDISRIKSFWGPWPHALSAAGLTQSKEAERVEKNREKHIRSKTNRKKGSRL